VENVHEPYLVEVLDFVRFIETRTLDEKMELAIASETSLKKDWLKHEEDEAWKEFVKAMWLLFPFHRNINYITS